jgi:SAM-dependent methyltransferase
MKPHEQDRHRKPIATDARVRPVAPQGSVRLKVFYKFLPSISAFFRRRRMSKFAEIVKIRPGARVLDLGGAPAIWEHVSVPLKITLLNLPGSLSPGEFEILKSPHLRHHTFHVIEGDACNVEQFGDHCFDLVFSNSVIEHVGPPPKQAEFAHEVLRLGKSYWVQTPSKWFPIEVHSGVLFYWFYPEWLRAALMKSWRKRLPAWWADYMDTTRVLSRRRMAELFPNGRTRVDYFFGFPKSYVSYFTGA